MNTEHFVKLKNMYLRANINTYIYDSIECEIELKKCTISMTISEKYFHFYTYSLSPLKSSCKKLIYTIKIVM